MATAGQHVSLEHSRVLIDSSNADFRTQWIENPQNDATDVGLGLFIALTAIQYLVINHGAMDDAARFGQRDSFPRSIEAPVPGALSSLRAAQLLRSVLGGLQRLLGDPIAIASTILPCSSPRWFHFRCLLDPFLPRDVVLSSAGMFANLSVQSLGVVR